MDRKFMKLQGTCLPDRSHANETVRYITQFPDPENFEFSEAVWKERHGTSHVIVNCFSEDIFYDKHWTPFSIKCAFNGKESYKFDNHTFAVSDKSFLVLNEGATYESFIRSKTMVESFSLNYSPKDIATLAEIYECTPEIILDNPFYTGNTTFRFYERIYPFNQELLGYINRLRQRSFHPPCANNQAIELLYLVLFELVKCNASTSTAVDAMTAKKRSTREELYKRLSKAKDYMYSCYQEEITLSDLSKVSFLNPAYLLREFKKLFGVTPHQFLIHVRMEKAKDIIRSTDKQISQIVTDVGFIDFSSFSKSFKTRYGSSPKTFRNKSTQPADSL